MTKAELKHKKLILNQQETKRYVFTFYPDRIKNMDDWDNRGYQHKYFLDENLKSKNKSSAEKECMGFLKKINVSGRAVLIAIKKYKDMQVFKTLKEWNLVRVRE